MIHKFFLIGLIVLATQSIGYAQKEAETAGASKAEDNSLPWTYALILGTGCAGLTRGSRRKKLESKIQEAQLKWQLVKHTKLDSFRGTYGEFFLRRSPADPTDPDMIAKATDGGYTRIAITSIQRDYIYLTDAAFPVTYLKEESNGWSYANQDGIGIKTVFQIIRLDYKDIDFIHWDVTENWDHPQIFCKSSKKDGFPANRILFAEKVYNGERFLYRFVCNQSELAHCSKFQSK